MCPFLAKWVIEEYCHSASTLCHWKAILVLAGGSVLAWTPVTILREKIKGLLVGLRQLQATLFTALWISIVFIIQCTIIQTFFHIMLFLKIWCILPLLYLPGRYFSKVRQKKTYTGYWEVDASYYSTVTWQVFLIATSCLPSPSVLQTLQNFW